MNGKTREDIVFVISYSKNSISGNEGCLMNANGKFLDEFAGNDGRSGEPSERSGHRGRYSGHDSGSPDIHAFDNETFRG